MHECEPALFTKVRESWVCVSCGFIAPACFHPKPEAMAAPDRFIADHFLIITVKDK